MILKFWKQVCYFLFCLLVRSQYFTPDSNYISFIGVTKESDKISTKSSNEENFDEFILELGDLHDSIVDVPEQFENKSDSFELSQNVEKFGKNISGRYYYKRK